MRSIFTYNIVSHIFYLVFPLLFIISLTQKKRERERERVLIYLLDFNIIFDDNSSPNQMLILNFLEIRILLLTTNERNETNDDLLFWHHSSSTIDQFNDIELINLVVTNKQNKNS